jgi:hypothetical protein
MLNLEHFAEMRKSLLFIQLPIFSFYIKSFFKWVSGCWLLNTKWAICQQYHGENKVHSMIWWCSRYIKMPNLILIVLVHWNNSLWVDMSLHLDTLSLLRANQSLLYSIILCSLWKSSIIPILLSDLTWTGMWRQIYYTGGEHAKHYTTNVVGKNWCELKKKKLVLFKNGT